MNIAAKNPFRMVFFACAIVALGAACATTELELAKSDPAHPGALAGSRARSSGVLGSDYDPLAAAAEPAAEGGKKYTCPMHPEIVRSEPGTCPICKMDLVPQKPKSSQEGAHEHEHAD